MSSSKVSVPVPRLQVDFASMLEEIRSNFLQEALGETVRRMSIATIDQQLSEYVPHEHLQDLARCGLRGELVYSVPCLLEENPRLLGYYRLLLGFSQKEFYSSSLGLSVFKTLETNGRLSNSNRNLLPALCRELIASASWLLEGIGVERISRKILDDLTLLTVGPQLRGGANVKKGAVAIKEVFHAIHLIVAHAVQEFSPRSIELKNAAGRKVLIEFAPDPDIVILEEIGKNRFRNIIAIEVKGGEDFSNIHNRIGEAEKSHRKARGRGFVECWTVVNVKNMDLEMAKKESPTTDMFFQLADIQSQEGGAYQDFRSRILSLTGISGG